MPSTRNKTNELIAWAKKQALKEEDGLPESKLPFNPALFKADATKLGWKSTDIIEWITSPALVHLRQWKIAVLDPEPMFAEFQKSVGSPEDWRDISDILKLCAKSSIMTKDLSSLDSPEMTARTMVNISKDSCVDTKWSVAFTKSPKRCHMMALSLIMTVVANMHVKTNESWFHDLLVGKPLSLVPFESKSSDAERRAIKPRAPAALKGNAKGSTVSKEQEAATAAGQKRGAETGKEAKAKRKRVRWQLAEDVETESDDDGPDSVPAVAPPDEPPPPREPLYQDQLRNMARKHQNTEHELHNLMRKAREERDAAKADKETSSKEVLQARQKQRDGQERSANLQKQVALLDHRIQNNGVQIPNTIQVIPNSVDQVFANARSNVLQLSALDWDRACQLIMLHPTYQNLHRTSQSQQTQTLSLSSTVENLRGQLQSVKQDARTANANLERQLMTLGTNNLEVQMEVKRLTAHMHTTFAYGGPVASTGVQTEDNSPGRIGDRSSDEAEPSARTASGASGTAVCPIEINDGSKEDNISQKSLTIESQLSMKEAELASKDRQIQGLNSKLDTTSSQLSQLQRDVARQRENDNRMQQREEIKRLKHKCGEKIGGCKCEKCGRL